MLNKAKESVITTSQYMENKNRRIEIIKKKNRNSGVKNGITKMKKKIH